MSSTTVQTSTGTHGNPSWLTKTGGGVMGGIVFVPGYIIVGTGATMIHSPGSLYKNPNEHEPCGERAKAAAEN